MDVSREAEGTDAFPLFLELRESDVAFKFALFFQFQAAKEVGIGAVKITPGFLGGALGYLIHPGEVSLFQGIEFSMQRDRRGTFPCCTAHFLRPSQRPIVGKAGTTRMFETGGTLFMVEV